MGFSMVHACNMGVEEKAKNSENLSAGKKVYCAPLPAKDFKLRTTLSFQGTAFPICLIHDYGSIMFIVLRE